MKLLCALAFIVIAQQCICTHAVSFSYRVGSLRDSRGARMTTPKASRPLAAGSHKFMQTATSNSHKIVAALKKNYCESKSPDQCSKAALAGVIAAVQAADWSDLQTYAAPVKAIQDICPAAQYLYEQDILKVEESQYKVAIETMVKSLQKRCDAIREEAQSVFDKAKARHAERMQRYNKYRFGELNKPDENDESNKKADILDGIEGVTVFRNPREYTRVPDPDNEDSPGFKAWKDANKINYAYSDRKEEVLLFYEDHLRELEQSILEDEADMRKAAIFMIGNPEKDCKKPVQCEMTNER